MSEVRLVRCPKCYKVLPEPPLIIVYQCGGCGCMLRAKKKSSESDNLVNSDKRIELEEGVKDRDFFEMGSKSPLRSESGENRGGKSPMEGSDLNEFHGGFPKSPMRERFLNDISSSPVESRYTSPSRMRGWGSGDLDVDEGGTSPARPRNVSMSPLRERGNKSPMSVRTRNASKSPIREKDCVKRSPAGSLNGKIANLSLREDGDFDFYGSAANEPEGLGVNCDGIDEGMTRDKMAPKTSFNTWLSDSNDANESNGNDFGRRRNKWRDRVSDDADRISEEKESVYADDPGMTSEGSVNNRTHGDLRLRNDYVGKNRRPRTSIDQRFGSDGIGMMHGNARVSYESGRNSASSSSVDGPLGYSPESVYRYGHSRHNFETRRGPNELHYIERDEFIQKYRGVGDHSDEEYLRFGQGSTHQFLPDRNMPKSSYFINGPNMVHEMEDVYNHLSSHEYPYAGQMGNMRLPKQQFSRHAMPGYAQRQSLDFDRDSFNHQADWEGHGQLSCFRGTIAPTMGAYPTSSRSMDVQRPGPRTYDPRMAHTAPRDRPSHLAPHHTRRVLVASQNKRLCLPIAGGAPFLLCHSCFELLKLPGKFMTKKKTEYKLQCGACSTMILFDLQNMSFGVLSSQKKLDTVNGASEPGEVLKESSHRRYHDSFGATSTTLGSYDFDAGRRSFHSMKSESNEQSRGHRSGMNYDGHTRGTSLSSGVSKEDVLSDNASTRNSESSSSEMPLKLRPPPGSPLREHLDYSTQYHKVDAEYAASNCGKEMQEFEKETSQESSVLTREVSSETELHSHELSTSVSDPGNVLKGYKDENRDSQSSRSPFWKPFGSKSVPSSPGKGEVFVNGQQVPHHVVRKAEKLAGSIEPGEYWYDPKAGFWGAMGHRCLGIIPPSIQEFSFPLQENCCKGDTTVYVNGRELHKRDLDLLASRGLPTTREKRYIIDISGKVLEESSKDFIANLGKLAPSVEKNKRGFGMRVPEKLID